MTPENHIITMLDLTQVLTPKELVKLGEMMLESQSGTDETVRSTSAKAAKRVNAKTAKNRTAKAAKSVNAKGAKRVNAKSAKRGSVKTL